MFNRKTKAALLASSVILGSLAATPALAQDVDEGEVASEEAIIVTGSRIQRRNVETAAPIAVVPDEEFSLSGTVNVENVVNTLPQVIPGFTSASNNPGNGTATLNLRGLGASRSLVLVNGRRWMFFDTSQLVDLNTIPAFLIDSVDVVTGGASAVYGSDALAGVVNFRLRHVDGVEVGGQYAVTGEGDGDRYEIHGAIGTDFADGRGRATVFGEYYNRKPVFQGDRAFSEFALGGETFGLPLQQFGSSTMPALRFNAPGSTVVNGTTFNLGSGLTIDDAIFDVGNGGARARAGDTYNYAPANYLQIPQERYLMGGYAEYEIADFAEAYTEIAFVNNRVATELAATPVTGTFNVNLAAVQPLVSTAVFQQLQTLDARETAANAARLAAGLSPLAGAAPGVVSTSLQRRIVETGSRNSLDERNAFRILAGLRGDITDYLQYDAYYTYNRTRNGNIQAGNISRSAFQAGLDGTASAIDIFDVGGLTPAQVDQISILAQNTDISTLEVASAAISGTLGDFAIGSAEPVGFALGGEYRRVASQFIPDTALASGDVIGFNAGDPTEGSYNVKEVFGELSVPIEFGSSRLEFTGAARYSDYSLEAVGGVFTYAGGVEFAPIPDVTLRAQYQHAIRAPNVAELFQGTAIGFPGATDPCGTSAATSGTLRDLCIANGVPAANLGRAAIVQPNTQIPALFGGNPNLQEETSDSYTFGVVLQPRAIPGFTLTADYFNIEIEDAISTISLQQSFDLCFNQFQDAANPLCGPFFAFGNIRNAEGAIEVDAPPVLGGQNIANFQVSGIDLQVAYNMDLGFSVLGNDGADLNLSLLGTWTEESSFLATPDSDLLDCAGIFGSTCGQPTPTFKWTARATYADGPLTFSTRWRHLSAVDDDDSSVDYGDFNGSERIPAYDVLDLTLAYDYNDAVTFTVGVDNVFDTMPMTPTFNGIIVSNANNGTLLGDNQEQGNTYGSTYETLGRDFFASVLFRF